MSKPTDKELKTFLKLIDEYTEYNTFGNSTLAMIEEKRAWKNAIIHELSHRQIAARKQKHAE